MRGFILFSLSSALIFINGMQIEAKAEVKTKQRCQECIVEQEKQKGIEPGLLEAIAHVESRMARYVVNACGRGYSFSSAAEAARFVQAKQKEGYRNISVGLMQLHVPSHRSKFKSIEEMMDPDKNIAYAANLLKKLKKQTGSWENAVKRYNGGEGTCYKNRVFGAWAKIRIKRRHSICQQTKNIAKGVTRSEYKTLLSSFNAAARLALLEQGAYQNQKLSKPVASKVIRRGKNPKKALPCSQDKYLVCLNMVKHPLSVYGASLCGNQSKIQRLIA